MNIALFGGIYVLSLLGIVMFGILMEKLTDTFGLFWSLGLFGVILLVVGLFSN